MYSALDSKPHLNMGYLSLWDTLAYQHVSRLIGNPGAMMLPPLQLPSHRNPFCGGTSTWCWRKERQYEKSVWSTKRSQEKTERHLDISISYRKKCNPRLTNRIGTASWVAGCGITSIKKYTAQDQGSPSGPAKVGFREESTWTCVPKLPGRLFGFALNK